MEDIIVITSYRHMSCLCIIYATFICAQCI